MANEQAVRGQKSGFFVRISEKRGIFGSREAAAERRFRQSLTRANDHRPNAFRAIHSNTRCGRIRLSGTTIVCVNMPTA